MIDHEAADELLAGYVLGSLTGSDAEEADRLLTEHVPDCVTCRTTLEAFQGVTGELGLLPPPAEPPDTLFPRLQRELEGRGRRPGMRGWSPARIVAGAAAAVVLVGAAGIALTQTGSGPSQPLTRADLAQVRTMAEDPETEVDDIGGGTSEVVPPSREELYLMGTSVASPQPGYTYRLWAVQGDTATFVGDFVPDNGLVVLKVSVDPSTVDKLIVTEEPAGSVPSQPGQPAWEAAG